ncbi:hypothetical protein D3C85_1193520 [compost metagenome]
MGGHRATSDAATQLVELRKTQTFRVFDDHQTGIGYIHADFDNCSGDQQMQLALFECLHHGLLFSRFHSAMNQSDIQLGKR